MRNVVLYGIHGIHNYGCEAMVRAISSLIKEYNKETIVTYMSYSYEEDKKRLIDCESIEIKPLEVHAKKKNLKNMYAWGLKFIKKKLAIAKPLDRLPFDGKWLKTCDTLIIIGGDVFDLLPNQKNSYNNERIWASKVVNENGGATYLWGISLGDFESSIIGKKTIINYFKHDVCKAAIRDTNSLNFLKANGITNAKVFADPAFMIRGLQTLSNNSSVPVLGINLSPLSNRYLDIKLDNEKWPEYWANIIEKICIELGYKHVLLIPHVCTREKGDDDYDYLNDIHKVLNSKSINSSLAPRDIGFIGIKEYICKCSLLLSARMHCCVNAITCGVPTVFLSYSPKSIGMCEFVYGNNQNVIDMNKINEEDTILKLRHINSNANTIKKYLSKRNSELRDDARKAITYLFDM